MKTYRSLALVALSILFLAACAAPSTPAPAPTSPPAVAPTAVVPAPTSPPAVAATSAPAVQKKFALWHVQTGDGPKVIQAEVDRYMADHPGVSVEVDYVQSDSYPVKLKVAMGAGNPPCIFTSWSGGPLYEYVKGGQVTDLTAMMNKDNYKDKFLDAGVKMATFDNKIYAVPVEHSAAAVIFYNKKLFADNNITVPTTYDELLDVVKKLKGAGLAPFALGGKSQWPELFYITYLVDRIGGPDVFPAAANRTGSFEDPAFVKAGQMIQDLVKMGAFNEGFNGLDYSTGQSRALLYSGKAAMEFMGSWNISTIKGENPDFYKNNLDFFPFPAVKDGKGDPSDVAGSIGQDFYSISASCPYPQEAFQVIQYMIDDKAIAERKAIGRLVPVKGFTPDDPQLVKVMNLLQNAKNVQLWYDQYLPPELGQASLDTTQALFGLTMTPEQAAKTMEDAAVKYYSK